MTGSRSFRVAAALMLAVIALAAGLGYLATHDVGAPLGDLIHGRAPVRWPPPTTRHAGAAATAAAGLRMAGHALLVAVAVTTAAAAPLLAARRRARRRRLAAAEAWELGLSRDDVTNPFKVQEAFEGIAGSLSARWYRRLWAGQDHLTLEVERDRVGTITFRALGTEAVVRTLRATLKELYPDVLLRPAVRTPPPADVVIRLKKAHTYVLSLQAVRDYKHAFSEALVACLDTALGPAGVQLVLSPAPRFLHRRSRLLLKQRERALNYRDAHDELDPGTGSVLEAKELRAALRIQHRSLFYFDLRVFACEREDAARVAGLFAQLRAENELVRREIRLRRALYTRRIEAAAPNPLPGTRTGLLATPELATLWQLPRARVKEVRLNRSTVRRALAPPEVERSAALQLMEDEQGPVGLAASDRQYGHALVGGQGGGKSSVMARSIMAAARDDSRALVIFDPKGPLAELARGVLPAERVVHYLDLAAPEFGFNPLALDASPALRASLVVRAIIEANPPGAIQAASDSFLRQAIAAVCRVERAPTFWHVYRMFDFDPDAAYRAHVVERLSALSGTDFAQTYWRRDFPLLLRNRSFAAQGLNPPRNKVERLIATPELDVMLRHPHALDVTGLLERGEILIVCGAKAAVGEDNVVFVMQLLLQLLHCVIQAQQSPLGPRRGVSLFIDEAHNLLTPSVATMLAEGRSAGLEAAFAWQYSAQIADSVIRSGLQSLLQSISIFRMREMDDARSLAGLAMEVYSDRISADIGEQERLRFSADDIVRLPAHRAINLWIAGGVPRPGFVTTSLPMEGLYDPRLAETHALRQRERGGSHIASLPDPLAGWDGAAARERNRPRGGSRERLAVGPPAADAPQQLVVDLDDIA